MATHLSAILIRTRMLLPAMQLHAARAAAHSILDVNVQTRNGMKCEACCTFLNLSAMSGMI